VARDFDEVLDIGQPVYVSRGGDPALPSAWDGKTGKVHGHSVTRQNGVSVPTVGVYWDDRKMSPRVAWIVRWHVRARAETRKERVKRWVRSHAKELLTA
jgi:hypothetical protein